MSDGQQTNLGVAPNVGGTLCYAPCCIGFIFSIVAVVVEKQSKFVRFHAFQSLLFHGVALILGFGMQAASILAATLVGALGGLIGLLGIPIGLALLGLNIFLMVKAYGNEEGEIPVVGPMAKQWASN